MGNMGITECCNSLKSPCAEENDKNQGDEKNPKQVKKDKENDKDEKNQSGMTEGGSGDQA